MALIAGTRKADSLAGTNLADLIVALDGNDTIDSGAGNDVILAGIGNDVVRAGAGNDIVDGGAGNDLIAAGDGNDAAAGGLGNDTIEGGAGNDLLQGGAGADQLDGGADADTAACLLSPAGVTVDLAAGTGKGGDAEGDVLVGVENVMGSRFNDVLVGDAGENSLSGGNGSDRLAGGAGSDVLRGGLGSDKFVLGNVAEALTGADEITDFSVRAPMAGGDILDISQLIAGFAAAPATLQALVDEGFLTFSAASGKVGTVIGFDADGAAGAGGATGTAALLDGVAFVSSAISVAVLEDNIVLAVA